MKKTILIDVHKEAGTNALLLDSQDAFNFIGETELQEMEIYYYIEKWSEYLNYPFTHSSTCNGNPDLSSLRGFIDGYNFAKHAEEQEFTDRFVVTMRNFVITFMKPFMI